VKSVIVATAFSLVAGGALAQGVTETTTTTTTISPADQSEMRDFVVKEHRAAVPPPPGFVVTNGVALPESVDLYSFPPERHWNYEYTTIGDDTVLVEPHTRRIIGIIH
jgi:hypothetical protein